MFPLNLLIKLQNNLDKYQSLTEVNIFSQYLLKTQGYYPAFIKQRGETLPESRNS